MKKATHILLCLLSMGALVNAQEKALKKAEDNFNNYAYADAISSYEDLIKKGYTQEQVFKNLGDANYFNADYGTAAEWYGKLLKLVDIESDPEYIYRHAQALKSLEKYRESDQWMDMFLVAKANDRRARMFADNTDYLAQIEDQSGRYDLNNLSINSKESDFAPSFHGNRLVFSTARDSGVTTQNLHKWNNKSFLNLYTTTLTQNGNPTNPHQLSKSLNKKTHESSTAFTKDGSTVYFTRNNSTNGNFARDSKGVSRLKIYRATLKEGKWTKIKELPFNSNRYSVAHPALSPDEKQLYFASDMPGSMGASDIFVVDINADGSFGTPRNLGDKINTEARETFPFVTDSNVLYFSSDGYPGLGGLDIFATKLDNLDHPYVVNVGTPVNSKEDDFSFIMNDQTKKGYFASNREGGLGDDDIYSFIENKPIDLECTNLITGMVKDQMNKAPLAAAKVMITDADNKIVAEVQSNADGSFSMELTCKSGTYQLDVSKEGYSNGDGLVTTLNRRQTSDVTILLEPLRRAASVGTELVQYLNLEPIYFDLDKYNIREDAKHSMGRIIAYMNEFPRIKVQIGSHTDARASKAYNIRLSNKRANKTMEYLIEQGIEPFRLTSLGLGESMLTNQCSDGVPCTKAQHQENRRSEFIVVE